MEIFVEISVLLFIATVFALLMRALKQPLVVGYIIAGVVAGPYLLNILHSKEHIELFSKIGITILLFIVGLNLSPKVIKDVGKVSVIGGLGQIIFTSLIGFSIAVFLGIDRIAAMYVAIALTFSSTIIVLKLLSDRGDLNKLYGKIAIGFLIVQDVIATLTLLLVSSFSKAPTANLAQVVGLLLLKSFIILLILLVVSNYILPRVSKFVASSQEILFLFALSWGLGTASLFAKLGLSMEIGALIAGVTLSLTPFAYEIAARLKPLRDFFIVLFFVLLGSQVVFDNITQILLPALVLSLFVLIGNPVIVIVIMSILGHRRRTSFMTGLAIAQISEFSLILAALGYNLGHITQDILSIITIVGLITIAGSTYFLIYADSLYKKLERILKLLELENSRKDIKDSDKYKAILFGYGRVGDDFVNVFKKINKSFLVVDFNPDSIQKLNALELPNKYGDAQDIEFLQELNLSQVEICVSTIPGFKTNIILTKTIREENKRAIIIVLSHFLKEAEELYKAGASYVIMPHYLSAKHATNMIARLETSIKEFDEEKEKHLLYIEKKKINLVR
ncbi:MAG TPA: cation:proton antiporter family protein [Xanthomonadales bacterium]|nr:cation:proton antiporter family protein [Xanthomonadales bacterium]